MTCLNIFFFKIFMGITSFSVFKLCEKKIYIIKLTFFLKRAERPGFFLKKDK